MAGFAAGFGGCAPRAGKDGIAWLSITELGAGFKSRAFTPLDAANACLDRIARLDRRLNSFITVAAESAKTEAARAGAEIAAGHWRGPLHGVPIAIKDNIDTAGVLTTAASAVFADRLPTEDAEVTARLKAAGAVILGKLNMHEFALGTTSATSHYGPVRNPWNTSRVAGGSSGGCGAAVAAGLCYGAAGTDTGGSVRIPAAACGVVGMKPTYGKVSTKGVVLISEAYDHVGPLCRSVADTALMLQAMTGDEGIAAYDAQNPPSPHGLRVGVLEDTARYCDAPEIDAAIAKSFALALDILRPLVAELVPAEIPTEDLGAIIDAEAYVFHAPHLNATPELYQKSTRDGLLAGADPEADIPALRAALDAYRAGIGAAFSNADLVVIPTLPSPVPLISDAADPFATLACTFPFSTGGLPAISVPCGLADGMPVGLMIAGPPNADAAVLALAAAYEKAAALRLRPPL